MTDATWFTPSSWARLDVVGGAHLNPDDVRTVERAVMPVYTMRGNTPRQTGSSVLLRIADSYFVLGAAHVVDGPSVLLGCPHDNEVQSVVGERASTKPDPSGTHNRDPVDAAALRVTDGLTAAQQTLAIGLDAVDSEALDEDDCLHAAIGFRYKKHRFIGRAAIADRFVSTQLSAEQYAIVGLDPAQHLALVFDHVVITGGEPTTAPSLQGFSGGAIVRYRQDTPDTSKSHVSSVLSAITTASRNRGRNKRPSTIWGTRIDIHLGLIASSFPDVRGLDRWSGSAK